MFTAFSGSHQDAINKGIRYRKEHNLPTWEVPYLHSTGGSGRQYEHVRINSQSGKGGVSYILKQNYSISIPEKMRADVGYTVKQASDEAHKELPPQQVYEIFL